MPGAPALQAKIIDEPIFVALIVMTVSGILIAGPAMKYYLNKDMAGKRAEKTSLAIMPAA
ncbi:hypothetical protein [Parafilimonas sp.]|uniref:hypothetical protein n=1 Tax=Parafilimonas sp. TaxID=1969739 RepID=UPI0039E59EAB